MGLKICKRSLNEMRHKIVWSHEMRRWKLYVDMAMLGAESSQAERRKCSKCKFKLKENARNVGLFLMGRDLDPVELSPQTLRAFSSLSLNLHHLDKPDGKHPYLEGVRDTRALCQRLHSIILTTKIISTSLWHHANAPLVSQCRSLCAPQSSPLALSIAQSNSNWGRLRGEQRRVTTRYKGIS